MEADVELVGTALDAVGHGGLDRVAFGEDLLRFPVSAVLVRSEVFPANPRVSVRVVAESPPVLSVWLLLETTSSVVNKARQRGELLSIGV